MFGPSKFPSWSSRGGRVLAAGVVSTIAPNGALLIDIRERTLLNEERCAGFYKEAARL